eukprot:s409_g2.t1
MASADLDLHPGPRCYQGEVQQVSEPDRVHDALGLDYGPASLAVPLECWPSWGEDARGEKSVLRWEPELCRRVQQRPRGHRGTGNRAVRRGPVKAVGERDRRGRLQGPAQRCHLELHLLPEGPVL